MPPRSRSCRVAAAGLLLTAAGSLLVPGTPAASAALAPPPGMQSGTGYAGSEVVPVGDLDHDGRRDLVVITQPKSIDPDPTTSTFTAYSGRTGARLWRRTLDTHSGSGAAYPAGHVGSGGGAGVVLVTTSNPGETFSLVARGVTGSGSVAWTHTETGGETGPTITDLPANLGLVPDSGHQGLLLSLLSTTILPSGPTATSDQAVMVDTVDGSSRRVGSPFTVTSGYLAISAAPDVTRDGTAEVAAVEFVTGEDHQSLVLRDGATGSDLWTTSVPGSQPTLTYVQPVGDVTGDGHPDVVEQGYQQGSDGFGYLPATLLDGASGTVVWSRPGYAEEIGGGVHAVLLEGDPVVAVRADGSTLWRRAGSSGYVLGTGDVDADGTFDQFLTTGSATHVISSRTGRSLWGAHAISATPLGAAVDGHGDDFVALTGTSSRVRVTVRSGRTGHRLWSVVERGMSSQDSSAQAADLTGDRCANILLVGGSTLRVLSGAGGQRLWSLRLGDGHVVRGARRPRRC